MVDTSDSEECIFTIESVGAICHNQQNQYFVSLKFMHSGRNTVIKCQLDTGLPVMSCHTQIDVLCNKVTTQECNQQPQD